MIRFRMVVSGALVATAALNSCGVAEELTSRRKGDRSDAKDESPTLKLAASSDGRLPAPVTWEAAPWAMPLRASAFSVSALGLTTDTVVVSDTTAYLNAARYSAMGEAADLELTREVARRLSVRRGFTSLNDALTQYRATAAQPGFALAAPSGDLFKDYLRESPQVILGSATNNRAVIGLACGACHSSVGVKDLSASSRVVFAEPFAPAQPSRVGTPVDSATAMADVEALVAAGPQSGDTDAMRAWYVLAGIAIDRINSDKCDGAAANASTGEPAHWKCSKAYINALVANSSARDGIDRGYLMALAIGAGAADVGKWVAFGYVPSDDQIDVLTETVPAKAIDWGGSRAAITNEIMSLDPLLIDKRSARQPNLFSLSGGFAPLDIGSGFSLNYAKGMAGSFGFMGYRNYLLGATYLRSPKLTSDFVSAAQLARGGFGAGATEWNRFIAALPRYLPANLSANGAAYFNGLQTSQKGLPTAAMTTFTDQELNAAVPLYNNSCGGCHGSLGAPNGGKVALVAPPSTLAYIQGGASLSAKIINQIIAANQTNKLPSVISSMIYGGVFDSSAVVTSAASRTGPWRYTRMNPYSGHADVATFLNAGGGTAAAGTYLIPRNRNSMGNYTPVALGPDRATLKASYGIPEQTGGVKHPTFTPVTGSNAAILSKFLVTAMADGGYGIALTYTSSSSSGSTSTSSSYASTSASTSSSASSSTGSSYTSTSSSASTSSSYTSASSSASTSSSYTSTSSSASTSSSYPSTSSAPSTSTSSSSVSYSGVSPYYITPGGL